MSCSPVSARSSAATSLRSVRSASAIRWQAVTEMCIRDSSVPYSAGGSQALGVASAEQRLLAAMLREPSYIPQVRAQLSPEKFVPVSYTHLDVYKRQAYTTLPAISPEP